MHTRPTNRSEAVAIPELWSPQEGMKLIDSSVHFCWGSTDDAIGYELQFSQSEDFTDSRSVVFQDLLASPRHAYLPEQQLPKGRWFWRTRTMAREGIFGNWSSPRSFTIVAVGRKRRPEIHISASRPLFIFYYQSVEDREIIEYWRKLPAHLKSFAVLRVDHSPAEKLVAICELAQQHAIPLMIQVACPLDSYDGQQYTRIPLADVEYIFQRFPNVMGVLIPEQSCQGGLKQRRIVRYLIGVFRLAAAYGRIAVWADGQWHGNNILIDALLHEELFRTIEECGEFIVPVWKMNCGWTPYAVQGPVFGMWMSGTVANWGVEPESWFWCEAGFRELDVQHGFKDGDVEQCPLPFWGQMVLMGLSAGATVYSFEPPNAIWHPSGEIVEAAKQVIFPLLSRIIEWHLIPSREEVQERVKIAYRASTIDTPWRQDGGVLKTLYQGTYGLDHPFQMIPSTGRYSWIPVLSPFTSEAALKKYSTIIDGGSFRDSEDVRAFFNNQYPLLSEGSAWSMKAGHRWMVTNHHENRDIEEHFSLPLIGSFVRIEGEVAVNSYLILSEEGGNTLRMHLNGRSDRKTPLVLVVRNGNAPRVEVKSESANCAFHFNQGTRELTLEASFTSGAVDLVIHSRKGR